MNRFLLLCHIITLSGVHAAKGREGVEVLPTTHVKIDFVCAPKFRAEQELVSNVPDKRDW